MFADIYYQGDSSYESVDYYSQPSITPQPGVALQPVQPDPLMAGTADANIPTWTPREYFLRVYECRLKNMKHELHNVVSRLLSKLEPYVSAAGWILYLPTSVMHVTEANRYKTL